MQFSSKLTVHLPVRQTLKQTPRRYSIWVLSLIKAKDKCIIIISDGWSTLSEGGSKTVFRCKVTQPLRMLTCVAAAWQEAQSVAGLFLVLVSSVIIYTVVTSNTPSITAAEQT